MKEKIVLSLTFCAISLGPIFAQGWNNESTSWEQLQKAEYGRNKTTQIAHKSSYEDEENRRYAREAARRLSEPKFRSEDWGKEFAWKAGYFTGRVILPSIGVAIIIGVIVYMLKALFAPSKNKRR